MFGTPEKKMIGTSTNIRNSRRVLYPAMTICEESWKDLIFNPDRKNSDYVGLDLSKNLDALGTSVSIHGILKSIAYFKRINETR